MSSLPLSAPALRPVAVSAVAARPVDWLWPGHLALGKPAVLEGDPGLGKSFVALDFFARLSTGRPWPDGAPGREAEALDRAAAFLAAVLADGPLAVRDVWTAAQAQGLSRRTLGRAKEELGVRSVWIRVEGQPVCHWAISRAEPTPSEHDETSLEPWLAPLREKYPGPTPLDDL
jgi:AAA domain